MKTVWFQILLLTIVAGTTLAQTKEKGKKVTNPIVKIETSLGTMTLELYRDIAPLHTENFLKLTKEGFYNGTTFHRVIQDFMVQGGDPNSKTDNRSTHGMGGPGYTTPAEIKMKNIRGSVAAARMGDQVNPKRESSGSQFYINVKDNTFLDNQYTVFGFVTTGMEVADAISKVAKDSRDNPLEKITIKVSVVQE